MSLIPRSILGAPSLVRFCRNRCLSIYSRSLLPVRFHRKIGRIVASSVDPEKLSTSPEKLSTDRRSFLDHVGHLSDKVSENFAIAAVTAFIIGLSFPNAFLWFNAGMVSLALGISMLAMGCTLDLDDFAILAQQPMHIIAGVALQYTIMPLTGFAISRIASLPNEIAAGVVLVSCCPGGVASNIVTFLAQGDVALSVAMTSISTTLAILMTPFLTTVLLGTLVPVDGWALLKSTIQVIMVPLVLGIGLKSLFPQFVKRMEKVAPLIAVVAVFLINVSITSQNAGSILQCGVLIFACVFTLHTVGFSFGYLLAKLLGLPAKSCITVSIEVGMQNSGLGAVLATKHFGDPLSSSVCVVSACSHSFLGGLLATWTRNRNNKHNSTYE
eukprot:g6274.t1